jgi:hypothetical protein
LLGKPEGKRPLGRPRRRRKDNVKYSAVSSSTDELHVSAFE